VPTPDPSRCLDLVRLVEDKASDPAAWPEPFRREPASSPPLIEIASGHWVEARGSPAIEARVSGLVPG
jgi:peptide/nickel transport system ATP-binding protein